MSDKSRPITGCGDRDDLRFRLLALPLRLGELGVSRFFFLAAEDFEVFGEEVDRREFIFPTFLLEPLQETFSFSVSHAAPYAPLILVGERPR